MTTYNFTAKMLLQIKIRKLLAFVAPSGEKYLIFILHKVRK